MMAVISSGGKFIYVSPAIYLPAFFVLFVAMLYWVIRSSKRKRKDGL